MNRLPSFIPHRSSKVPSGNHNIFRLFSVAVLLLLFGTITSDELVAQHFKAGDDCEIYYHKKWYRGKVLAVDRKGIKVEYVWIGTRPSTGVFKENDVRLLHEADALCRSRKWRSAGGEHTIEAALIKFANDKATLRKPDMTEVTLSMDKLSDADNRFVKRLMTSREAARKEAIAKGTLAPDGPPFPEFVTFDNNAPSVSTIPEQSDQLIPLDARPEYLDISQGGVGFPRKGFFQNLTRIIPVGGPDELVLGATDLGFTKEDWPSELLWISLAKKKILATCYVPAGEIVIDYNPRSKLLLTLSEKDVEGSRAATIWRVIPGKSEIEGILRWSIKNVSASSFTYGQGYIVADRIVVLRANKQKYIAWDVVAKKAVYEINQQSFFSPPIVPSANKGFLLVPEDKGLLVIDAKTGNAAMNLNIGTRVTAAAANETGILIAALTSNSLYVWDLKGQTTEPKIYKASSIGETFKGRIEWIDDRHILADGMSTRRLFSLDYEMVVWSYKFDWATSRESRNPKLTAIVNKRLVYTANISGKDSGFAVGAVDFPGPGVAEKISDIDVESLFILKPDSEVALKIDVGQHEATVRKALTEKVEANGWKINDSSPIKLEASMGRSEPTTTKYRKQDRFGRPVGEEISITVTPFYSNLKIIKADGKFSIWSSGTSTGAPSFLSAREGQTAQQLVDSYQKPDPEFFQRTTFPSKIMDPQYRGGVGSSTVGTRGIVTEE